MAFLQAKTTLLLVLVCAVATTALGCSCIAQTLQQKYRDESVTSVLRVRKVGKLSAFSTEGKGKLGLQPNYVLVKVIQTFKGCAPTEKFAIVQTPSDLNSCAVTFPKGSTLIFARRASKKEFGGLDVYVTHLCFGVVAWKNVKPKDRRFLRRRQVDCENGVSFCANGRSIFLKCAVGCPPCNVKGLVCETSVCRGCGSAAGEFVNETSLETFEQCPK